MRAPSVAYTVAISSPMMPPPTMSMRRGTDGSASAPVAVDDARVVWQERQAHGLAARRDDGALEGDGAALACFFLRGAGGFFDHHAVRARKAAVAAHDLHLAHLGHRGQAAREPAHHLGFVRAQLLEVDLRCAERHAGARQVLRRVHHRGHVQQGLGRDAAHVEAHAAELGVALDEHHAQPQVGRTKGRAVATRPAAEHEQVAFEVGRRVLCGSGGRCAFRSCLRLLCLCFKHIGA